MFFLQQRGIFSYAPFLQVFPCILHVVGRAEGISVSLVEGVSLIATWQRRQHEGSLFHVDEGSG